MLNNIITKRLILSKSTLSGRLSLARFAALNTQHLDSAISGAAASHGEINWGTFFKGVNPSDVAESDSKSIGKLLKALSYAPDSHETEE
jgi:hypothetical protein